ncbi:MAG: hypothetical protein GVY10_02475 [Verrucomicrobia bacterium]|jgi:hypothetical protein|nr:hypothetical protein [Verrucomicrobiota bacterium]
MKTLPERCEEHWTASAQTFAEGLALAEKITARHREHEDAPAAMREAAVLEEQFRHQFLPPEVGERVVGAVRYPLVGLSPEPLGLGYYCASAALEEGADRVRFSGSQAEVAPALLRGIGHFPRVGKIISHPVFGLRRRPRCMRSNGRPSMTAHTRSWEFMFRGWRERCCCRWRFPPG